MVSNSQKESMLIDEKVINKIYLIRGEKVMLDSDLAEMYGVETKRLNERVKRNIERFPDDFMFQLTDIELENLKSQYATSSWGGRRKLPYAFTEHDDKIILILDYIKQLENDIKSKRSNTTRRKIGH